MYASSIGGALDPCKPRPSIAKLFKIVADRIKGDSLLAIKWNDKGLG